MSNGMMAEVIFDSAVTAWVGYMVGSMRAWKRGYDSGYANGRQLGKVEGHIEVLRIMGKEVDARETM